ncbi:MAG: alpha-L-fucosidase, partial [Akkermansiaceae bacterium]
MKTHRLLKTLVAAVMAASVFPSSGEEISAETPAQHDARMAWWREAKFGMFIHWGLYAVPAGIYEEKPIESIGEWIMKNAKIPVATYAGYAKTFNPTGYDAEKWVKMA